MFTNNKVLVPTSNYVIYWTVHFSSTTTIMRLESLLVRALDSWSKGCEFESWQEGWVNFFSRDNFVCWLLFSACSSPMLPQWHVKDPSHSAKTAGGRLHLSMHTMLTQQSRSGLTMLLSRHSVGTYQEMSSQATPRGTLGHSRLSSLSHYRLIQA